MNTWLIGLVFTGMLASTGDERARTLDMHERFAYSAMMRTALIHGYPERARRHAGQLVLALEDTDSEGVQELAREVRAADSVPTMALGVARVANACGDCHQQNRVQPQFLGHTIPPQGESIAARMGRHIWAADRMWEALIAHSDSAWQRGTEVLAGRPFMSMPASDGALGEQLLKVDQLARDAAEAKDWEDRAALYGQFLGACADCHSQAER